MEKNKQHEFIARTHMDIAFVCGVKIDTVKSWSRQGMPGISGRYNLREVIDWLRNKGPWQQRIRPDFDDALLDGVDSPGLERCRLAKASLLELELEEKRNNVFNKDELRGVLLRWAGIIRRVAERIGKRYGNDAASAVNDALTECDYLVTNEFGTPDTAEASPSERT
jgi:phage terminase Nu1 subunit (DNA packaging protein)